MHTAGEGGWVLCAGGESGVVQRGVRVVEVAFEAAGEVEVEFRVVGAQGEGVEEVA